MSDTTEDQPVDLAGTIRQHLATITVRRRNPPEADR